MTQTKKTPPSLTEPETKEFDRKAEGAREDPAFFFKTITAQYPLLPDIAQKVLVEEIHWLKSEVLAIICETKPFGEMIAEHQVLIGEKEFVVYRLLNSGTKKASDPNTIAAFEALLKEMLVVRKKDSLGVRAKFFSKHMLSWTYLRESTDVEKDGITRNIFARCEERFGARARKQLQEKMFLLKQRLQKLMLHNLKLVLKVSKNGHYKKESISDGIMGLMHACERFDATRRTRFSTFAVPEIKVAVTRGMREQSASLHIPMHLHERMISVWNIEQKNPQFRNEEIAKKLSLTAKEIDEIRILELILHPISLDSPIPGEEDTETFLTLKDERTENSEEVNVSEMRKQDLLKILATTLTFREMVIILMRFGINLPRDHTLEEVGKELGLTRERIRQIEAKAIVKLQQIKELREMVD